MANTAPERIWQYRTDPLNEMYCGVEYVRADIHQELETKVAALRLALEEMATSYLNECPKGYYRYYQGVMKEMTDES